MNPGNLTLVNSANLGSELPIGMYIPPDGKHMYVATTANSRIYCFDRTISSGDIAPAATPYVDGAYQPSFIGGNAAGSQRGTSQPLHIPSVLYFLQMKISCLWFVGILAELVHFLAIRGIHQLVLLLHFQREMFLLESLGAGQWARQFSVTISMWDVFLGR